MSSSPTVEVKCPGCGETIEVEFRGKPPVPQENDEVKALKETVEQLTATIQEMKNNVTGNSGSSVNDENEDDE